MQRLLSTVLGSPTNNYLQGVFKAQSVCRNRQCLMFPTALWDPGACLQSSHSQRTLRLIWLSRTPACSIRQQRHQNARPQGWLGRKMPEQECIAPAAFCDSSVWVQTAMYVADKDTDSSSFYLAECFEGSCGRARFPWSTVGLVNLTARLQPLADLVPRQVKISQQRLQVVALETPALGPDACRRQDKQKRHMQKTCIK